LANAIVARDGSRRQSRDILVMAGRVPALSVFGADLFLASQRASAPHNGAKQNIRIAPIL
jgi:hypothetical protein